MQILYPSNVSRTLDPTGKSLITVVALHDNEISDADLNLMQDLADSKRTRLLADQTTSGAILYSPMQFQPFSSSIFLIPSFDVLFNNEVVTITGFQSADPTTNRVILPAPQYWTAGTLAEPASIYVVFLELWYQALDPETGQGYYTDPITGQNYFFPYGNVSPDPSQAESLPDDTLDPFQGIFTTERAQIQWRLNVQPVSLAYNFSTYQFGLDADTVDTSVYNVPLSVFPQTSNSQPISIYTYANMGGSTPNVAAINGDTGLWRAGDGNVNNALGTMDGYSYAMPVAVVFQRNSGPFSLSTNPFGCAVPGNSSSGLLAYGVSGRFDGKLADQIFPDDCVDTRSTVNVEGWDLRKIMAEGFTDIITGASRYAISRGVAPGNSPQALGSTLSYTMAVSPTAVTNADTVGQFDGFSNGFSTDQRTFMTTQAFPISSKSTGTGNPSGPWILGDSFTITLPATSNATITDVAVTALTNGINGTFIPVNLLQGQLGFSGLSSKAVTVSFVKSLTGTPFDPASNPLYVTLSVQYPASSGIDLRVVPFAVNGGELIDAVAGETLPVYGISAYEIQNPQPILPPLPGSAAAAAGIVCSNFLAINPEYSNVVFGTRIWLQIPGSQATLFTVGGSTIATFVIPRDTISDQVGGWYCTQCWDLTTGTFYNITNLTISATGPDELVVSISPISGINITTSTIVFSFIGENTCQLAYNAPVKGALTIEETVLVGNVTGIAGFPMDNRVSVASIAYDPINTNTNTVVLASNNAILRGISGNETVAFIWVLDSPVTGFTALQCSSASFNDGVVTVVCPASVNLLTQQFFFVASLLPAFDPNSTLIVESQYVPYQGEGVANRNYEILYNENDALITTNGTGAAPVVGLEDVYPYNRELPIITTLPSQISWNDGDLQNIPLETIFDDNFSTMRAANVEDTFLAPLHSNDFIVPVNHDIRKEIQFLTAGKRGWATAIPHFGFAIQPPTPKTVLGQNLQTTSAPIIIYVNNANGNDSNNGLTEAAALQTIGAAMALFPPVLRDPCSIQLIYTGIPYAITPNNSSFLTQIPLGDGTIVQTNWYALANIAFTVQGSGRFVISTAPNSVQPVVIDASAFTGFGNGPTSAFFVDSTRVIFNNLQFQGFTNPAVYGINSDIEFVNCTWQNNVQAGGFEQGCGIILTACSISLGDSATGFIVTGSELTVSNPELIVTSGASSPGTFFVAERQSNMTLQTHGTANENGVSNSIVIAEAEISSSIVCNSDWQSNGSAVVQVNSALQRTVLTNPFLGGITTDDSSSIVTGV
jgi:hypothetical protein